MRLLLVLCVAAVLSLSRLASAATITTFNFTGDCVFGCTGTASGTLVVQNYTFGDPLTPANFVSFVYNSNDTFLPMPYTITSPSIFSGSLGSGGVFFPGPSIFDIEGAFSRDFRFNDFAAGSFCANACLDEGFGSVTLGVPSVPEPPSALLFLGGLAAVAIFRRRRGWGLKSSFNALAL